MKRQSNTLLQIDEIWNAIQDANLDSHRKDLQSSINSGHASLKEAFEQLCREPVTMALCEELEAYLNGHYRDVLRHLEKTENPSHSSIILKVLCLLQMASTDELIGHVHPTEYLRDKVLSQLRQAEHIDGTGNLKLRREWLERFCLGHELPQAFWDANNR